MCTNLKYRMLGTSTAIFVESDHSLRELLRPDSSNLPCLHLTFLLEYPLVLSRF